MKNKLYLLALSSACVLSMDMPLPKSQKTQVARPVTEADLETFRQDWKKECEMQRTTAQMKNLSLDDRGTSNFYNKKKVAKNIRREEKQVARATSFLERLSYFNTAGECEQEMTTESDDDTEYEEGLITKEQLLQYKQHRKDNKAKNDSQIKNRKRNTRVAAWIKHVKSDDEKESLYRKLNSDKYKNLPTEEALKTLGYEADAEYSI